MPIIIRLKGSAATTLADCNPLRPPLSSRATAISEKGIQQKNGRAKDKGQNQQQATQQHVGV